MSYFSDRVLSWSQMAVLLPKPLCSWDYRHPPHTHTWLVLWDRVSPAFLPGLALNYNLPISVS
jgi:hypothetical protein